MQIHLIDTTFFGYSPITDYGIKLSVADAYGIEETKKTIEELTIEAKEDYKKLAELVFLLSLKTIEHKDDKDFLDLYIAKYAELGQYAFDTLEGEELKYFYQILRLKH